MKHILIIILSFFTCLFPANAQRQKKALEFEFAFGRIYATDKLFFSKNNPGNSPYVELRYNFKQVPVDIGIQWSGQIFSRDYRPKDQLGFPSHNITLTTDYNFRKYKNFTFFAGIGTGIGFIQNGESLKRPHPDQSLYTDGAEDRTFCIMPRIGLEFWDRIRLTLSYKLEDKANRHFGIHLGFVIGGGNKKIGM